MLSRSDSFHAMLESPEKLAYALACDADLIKEKDEEGMTLLHHAAEMGKFASLELATNVLDILLKSPGLSFTIKDRRGNTPLHLAAMCCGNRLTALYIFPALVKKATEFGFDFSLTGHTGETVFQIAAKRS